MTDENTINWEEVDVDEEVSETDHKASEDISSTTPVGNFVVTVVKCDAIEKTFKDYSCIAAKLTFRIDEVLMIERPIIDDNGKAIKRNGEVVQKIQTLPPNEIDKYKTLYSGQLVTDEINLFNPKEKEAMKKRRLFVAKKMRLIDQKSTSLPTQIWPGSIGARCVIKTAWNMWEDKVTKEIRKNVRVKWDGYDFAPDYSEKTGPSQEKQADTSFDTESFDI